MITSLQDIENSLQRTLQMSEAAVEVHQQANEQLHNQTEQLSRIMDDLVDMDDDVKRAKKFAFLIILSPSLRIHFFYTCSTYPQTCITTLPACLV